ncbi:MAG TPA: N-acetylmuramoyl-L-alanine amidase [Longimicrobium sp.]
MTNRMRTPFFRRAPALAAGALLAACTASTPGTGPAPEGTRMASTDPLSGTLPPIPAVRGPLRVDVVYPAEDARLTASDSNFVFGSVGTGEARLTINGDVVEVAPNGAFLAFIPVPRDGVYRVAASAGAEQATAVRRIRLPAGAGETTAGIAALAPRAAMTVQRGERVTVRFRGAPGGRARIVFPDGSAAPLVETRTVERDEGFLQDRSATREYTQYAGSFAATAPLLSRDRQVGVPTLAETGRAGTATIELVHGADTVRTPLELSLAVLSPGETRTAVAASDRPDSLTVATAIPGSGTPYHWTFPNGTRFTLTGEREGAYRVRLTEDQSVWVDARSVRLLPAGAPEARGTIGAVRVVPQAEWVDLRLAMTERLPARVLLEGSFLTVEVFGGESRTNWLYYGTEDPFVRRATWEQGRDDLYYVRMELASPAWGWRTFYDRDGTLVVRVRRPPAIDARRPLAGIHVAVDAGHPPGGAIGPTRLTEAEANLAISKQLVRMLRDAGARVTETRPDSAAVALGARPVMAEQAGAQLLVSVHNNAFPDGVNPFTNSGTTAFYNAPQSLDLARHMQREILRELGLRDLGIARADLALVRPTWMPSTLTESMFLMVPRQEAALRNPQAHERIARAHFRAVEAFLRERAGGVR